MADSGDNSGLGKLLLGGGIAWIVWQWAQSQGLLPGSCPPGLAQVRMPDGSTQCIPVSQIKAAQQLANGQWVLTLVGGIITMLISATPAIIAAIKAIAAAVGTGGSAAAGAGTGAATAAASVATTAVTTGAETAGTAAADASATAAADAADVAASVSLEALGGYAFGAVAIALIIWYEVTSALAARSSQQADLNKGAVRPDGGDAFTGSILDSEQGKVTDFITSLRDALNKKASACSPGDDPTKCGGIGVNPVGVYPNLNLATSIPQATATHGYHGYYGVFRQRPRMARSLGAYGLTLAKPLPSIATKTAVATTTTPGANTPYSFTQGYYDQTRAGQQYYFVNTVDPRLPLTMIRDFRGFVRWTYWLQNRAYNDTAWNYWSWRIANEGPINGMHDATTWAYPPGGAFDAAVAAFYGSLPVTLFPPANNQTFHTWQEVNAAAYEYLQALSVGLVAGGGAAINFDMMSAQVAFMGVSGAISTAGKVGFGGVGAGWPGDQQFSDQVRVACGLGNWGAAGLTYVADPTYGVHPVQRWLIQDPVTEWFVDVVGSRERGAPMTYKFVPSHAMGPGGVIVPDEYVPLNGYRGMVKRKRVVAGRRLGFAVPLERRDTNALSGLFNLFARGFST